MLAESVSSGRESLAMLLAVVSGLCFSCIAFTYKKAQGFGITPLHIVLVLGATGLLVYGVQMAQIDFLHAPPLVWWLAIAAGLTQYLTIKCLNIALKLGPLSATWCAMGLAFLPIMAVARIGFGETLSVWQFLGVAAAIACVVMASLAASGQPSPVAHTGEHRSGRARALAFGVVFILLMLVNSVGNIGQYVMGRMHVTLDPQSPTLLKEYGSILYTLLYLGLGGLVFLELLIKGQLKSDPKHTLRLGAVAATGSVIGVYCVGRASEMAGQIVFPINGVTAVLGSAFFGAVFFKEKRTPAWYATIILGATAVALGNIK